MFQIGYVQVTGSMACTEKLCQYFSNMTGKTHFYSKDKSPCDSFQCMEKQSELGTLQSQDAPCVLGISRL